MTEEIKGKEAVKALELENVAANDTIQLLKSRIGAMEASYNNMTLIGDKLYGDNKASPMSVSFSDDLFSGSTVCLTVHIIIQVIQVPVTLSECLNFGVDDMLPLMITCLDGLLSDTDCGTVT